MKASLGHLDEFLTVKQLAAPLVIGTESQAWLAMAMAASGLVGDPSLGGNII